MNRMRLARTLISLFGIVLGFWLMVGGLELRILSSYLDWHQQIIPIAYPDHFFGLRSLGPENLDAMAWPMVVFGTSWGGALVGFWIGETWSPTAMTLLCVLALAFPYPGTILAIIQLFLLYSTPGIRLLDSKNDGS